MWKVRWLEEAEEDMENLDGSIRKRVLKSIIKLEQDPYGYGEPLGTKSNIELKPFYKMEPCDGMRVVYAIRDETITVLVVVVGKREKMKVYKTAAGRMDAYRKETEEEMKKLQAIIERQK